MQNRFANFVIGLQQRIVSKIEEIDENLFKVDNWKRKEGGYGITCILQNGNVFEKAGVNVSVVHGAASLQMISHMQSRGKNIEEGIPTSFFASGISIVMHPKNPLAPTVHMNYRYFELIQNEEVISWWFGGGTDLTPSYLFEEDAKHFHSVYKSICDKYDNTFYERFKKWCDEYFYIPHREEHRGIGGIFFDDLNEGNIEELFLFVQDCGNSFLESYIPIISRRCHSEFTEKQKHWQQIRRGRYVEFNLVYDRGTKFGLVSGGRVESILMSLPEIARWEYMHEPEVGSPEYKLIQILKNPVCWQ